MATLPANIQNYLTDPVELFIDGEFTPAVSGEYVPVVNPHDNSEITSVAKAGTEDVERAVAAAQAALPAWAAMPAVERGNLLLKLADRIEEDLELLALLEAIDCGHPIKDTRSVDVLRTAAVYRYFGGAADKYQGTVVPVERGFLNYVTREPLGVVAGVLPWNYPLIMGAWKLAPALAAGNTCILKPPSITPLSSRRVAELAAEVGFPNGVINIVPGDAVVGAALVDHPGIAKISFTGSTGVGRKVAEAAGRTLKRTHLELGGKGANIVFEDANIRDAVEGSAFAIFHNQGQACIAGSRLFLHESIADEFIERFLKVAKRIRIGDPLDLTTQMGPLTSREHQERVLAFCETALKEGGEILYGGRRPDDPTLAKGNYVLPTIVRAKPEDTVCQEEVFGPFVTLTTFSNEEEVVQMANGTVYGLGGGFWTNDLKRAHRLAKKLRTGMVWVNAYKRGNAGSPFGGVGDSGYGPELGLEAMYEYTEAKSVWVNFDAPTVAWFGED